MQQSLSQKTSEAEGEEEGATFVHKKSLCFLLLSNLSPTRAQPWEETAMALPRTGPDSHTKSRDTLSHTFISGKTQL